MKYNDTNYIINKKFKKNFKKYLQKKHNKFAYDERLLNHFSNLFIREQMIIFPDMVKKDVSDNCTDFLGIQSSNWNDVRFKPPTDLTGKSSHWLVEFRPMDSPLLAKEKTAMIFWSTLFHRMIINKELGVNFYLPISKINKNFEVAIRRGSQTNFKFYFRKYFSKSLHGKLSEKDEYVLVSQEEFLSGSDNFDGMKALIDRFIELSKEKLISQSVLLNQDIISNIWNVYGFYLARARGELLTNASYIRKFVREHQDYQFDSEVSD